MKQEKINSRDTVIVEDTEIRNPPKINYRWIAKLFGVFIQQRIAYMNFVTY